MTARCIAMGERQPVRRSKKTEAKVKVERKEKASIWLLPFVMICELNSHPSTWTSASTCVLNARVPLVALILPVAALVVTDAGQCLHQFDPPHIFGLFVSKLPFETESKWRAMRNVQRGTI